MKKLLTHLWLVSVLCLTAAVCNAATLTIPAQSTHTVGQTFSVPIEVSTAQDAPLNAVSGILSFPSNLQAVAVDKSGIINFWVHDPTISNNAGTISFEGVALNPGFVGSHGVVFTVTFKVLAPGTAALSFPAASILANDGNGTEILTNAHGTQLALVSSLSPVAPIVRSPVSVYSAPSAPTPAQSLSCSTTTAGATASINPPTLIPVGDIDEGGMVKILGTSYPSAQVSAFIHGEKGVTYSQTIRTNAYGSFEIIWDQSIPSGIYSVTAQVVDQHGLRSANAPETFFQIKESAASMIGRTVLSNQFFFIVLALLGMGALVFFFGWHAGFIAITLEPEATAPGATHFTGIPSLTGNVRIRLTNQHRRSLDQKHPHPAH